MLTFVVLNKSRCHAHFWVSVHQITLFRLLIQFHVLNDKQCRSRSVGFFRSQLIWIYTVCKGRVYPGSAGQGFLTCPTLWVYSADDKLIIFFVFSQKIGFIVKETICIKCQGLLMEEKFACRRQFTFPEETDCMMCQSLFYGKNKKNIPKCHLLKFLPRVLCIKCPEIYLVLWILSVQKFTFL